VKHIPVLLNEALEALDVTPTGMYIDCTLGAGGHTLAIVSRLSTGSIISLDRDSYACNLFTHPNVKVVHQPFSRVDTVAASGTIDGILMDLGTSYEQLETDERGFSFRREGPLDMRMDNISTEPTAHYLLHHYTAEQLSFIFKEYSDERYHLRLARVIKQNLHSLHTTTDLSRLIEQEVGWYEKNQHPATRVFQALRIAVNSELKELTLGMEKAFSLLKSGGRLVIITFHSLEDRMVKKFMMTQVQQRKIAHFEIVGKARWVHKSIRTSPKEIKENVRSRSACLRCIEKL
jgi:16S rRNA (cytosine1402-N4)-methyltransferase